MSFKDLEKDTHLATFPSCLEVLMADLSRQLNILGLSDQDPAVQSASSTMQESLTSAESRVIQMKMCEKLYRFDLLSKASLGYQFYGSVITPPLVPLKLSITIVK